MSFEQVRVARENKEGMVKGILSPSDIDVWEVKGVNNAYAKFGLKNVASICPRLIHIEIKPNEHA
jgi:hypothetical protein